MTPVRLIGCAGANLSLLALAPATALAQVAAAPAAAPAAPAGPSLLPMLLVLVFVLALIPASIWLLKRLGGGSPATAAGLKVVAQLPLGPRERLVVVEAGERWLLLGVTASSINRVGTLPRGALPTGEPAGGFAQLLSAARRNHDK
ncbi:MAG: flagellar biosynthetic protein FliO [Burkholderiaceae bacterium]|jgi:flagellar protein FliO/FliZ|nr:flagellar biosynthetic protein FliO [Burkholderiaceae bacterium]